MILLSMKLRKSLFHKQDVVPVETIKGTDLKVPGFFLDFVTYGPTAGSIAIQLPVNYYSMQDVYHDVNYFSASHGAYKDGYTIETRVKKYKQAIENVLRDMDLRYGYSDLGGGLGYFTYGIAVTAVGTGLISRGEIAKYLHSIDPTEIPVNEEIRSSGINMEKGHLHSLPYKDGSMSALTCFHVLEHIDKDLLTESLNEIRRVMRDGAIVYLIIPTLDGRAQDNKEVFNQVLLDTTHITFGTRIWWQEQLSKTGLAERADLENRFDQLNYGWVFVYEKLPYSNKTSKA